jgi:ActR/RegA family two-component response regulator
MNQLSVLLLVDPDRRGLETLKYGFEREGCSVAGASDPALAGELVRATTPQLAVVSLRGTDGGGGIPLIGSLHAQANGSTLPVIALGPATLREAALGAGASDFLATPLFLRDVVNVSRLLAVAEPDASKPNGGEQREIQGRLSEYGGVYYLVRTMAATGRSGILLLSRGNRKAEVRFSGGAVTAAHVAALQGMPALHHLLLWEEAALSLKLRAVPKGGQLVLSPSDLLDECERFLRDFTFAARDLGSPRTVYFVVEPVARSAGLQSGPLAPVLRLFDGHRALADAIEESPFRIFDTLRVIKRLVETGALAVRPAGPGHGAAAAGERPARWLMEPWALVTDGLPDRGKKTSRRMRVMPATDSAPIPLTVKKPTPAAAMSSSASGEIRSRKRLRTPPIPLTQPVRSGTVEVSGARARVPTPAPLSAVAPVPPAAPLTAREPAVVAPAPAPARARAPTPVPAPVRPESRPRLKKVPSQPHVDPGPAFDDVETDFFAREADLYKSVPVESFDDLEHPSDSGAGAAATGKRRTRTGRKKR